MPILLPVLVRRSVPVEDRRGDPADRVAGLDRPAELDPALHAQLLQKIAIFVERMAGKEEADRVVFVLQPLAAGQGS